MIKWLKQIGATILLAMMLLIPASVSALNFDFNVRSDDETGLDVEADSIDILKDVTGGSGLGTFENENGRNVETEASLSQITGTLNRIINLIKWSLGTVAFLFIIQLAYKLLTATDQSEDVYTSAKKTFTYIAIGLASVFAIEIFVNEVFVLSTDTNFLGSVEEARTFAGIGSRELRGIYGIMQIFLGLIAVLVIVYQGVRLVANGGSEEVVEKAKKNITWGVVGLVLVGVSEVVVRDIIFVDAGQTLDINMAKRLFVQFTNFISGFVATAAVLMMLYAGYLYIFSAVGEDNTEKVKKTVIGAIIGILLAGGAFGIVNTLVEFEQPDLPELIRDQVDSNLGN